VAWKDYFCLTVGFLRLKFFKYSINRGTLAICQPRLDNASIALEVSRAEIARLENQTAQLLSQVEMLKVELKQVHSSKLFMIYRRYHALKQRFTRNKFF